MKLHMMTSVLALGLALSANPVRADFLKELGNAVSDGVDAVGDVVSDGADVVGDVFDVTAGALEGTVGQVGDIVKSAGEGIVAVNPLTVLVKVAEGESVDQVVGEAVEKAKTAVEAVATLPSVNNHLTQGAAGVTRVVLGDVAGDTVALVTLPASIAATLPSALTQNVVSISEGKDGFEKTVGIPMHAALEHVRQYYGDKGAALTPDLITLFEPTFGAEHLQTVRYVVDDSTGNIASLINAMQTQFGTGDVANHAVTVGNLIVFDREPGTAVDTLFFWAHEIQHTVQYRDMGFDGFAAKYTVDYAALEQEADQVALKAIEPIKALLAIMTPQG
jgi:hypothetical protein